MADGRATVKSKTLLNRGVIILLIQVLSKKLTLIRELICIALKNIKGPSIYFGKFMPLLAFVIMISIYACGTYCFHRAGWESDLTGEGIETFFSSEHQ
ncbi:hypothetical protein AA102526_2439 [Asaia lannensis NBRC 102526]|nr:hypothetical protein AA102526_2439 [Asaia lannensis NBRC 102526]